VPFAAICQLMWIKGSLAEAECRARARGLCGRVRMCVMHFSGFTRSRVCVLRGPEPRVRLCGWQRKLSI